MYLYTPLQHLLLGDGAGGEAEEEAEAADDLSGVEAEAAEDGEKSGGGRGGGSGLINTFNFY